MTRLLIVLFFIAAYPALAQVQLPTDANGQVQFQELVRLTDKTRPSKQVFSQSQAWAERYFKPANEPEVQPDLANGVLFVRGVYPIGEQFVRFTMLIEAKMGRYRATITDLIAENNGLLAPIQPNNATADDMQRAGGTQIANPAVVETVANQQAELYKALDAVCRDTLNNLKTALNG
ncbi:DUF4468 domain-containing protein [Spirosoma rhododendri]|uniref:DUF4468 domain-containing protein n=1 Tax=Spirosoma rhododendri TaxID=2728024 RepID=A0A7L5DNI3_9BACT|nr:DUF4468 domain-containing protein [Spirosoma rhododendri]QJD77617.1 DUF4468 domain-containing protein [Spirosoma rhododendri]